VIVWIYLLFQAAQPINKQIMNTEYMCTADSLADCLTFDLLTHIWSRFSMWLWTLTFTVAMVFAEEDSDRQQNVLDTRDSRSNKVDVKVPSTHTSDKSASNCPVRLVKYSDCSGDVAFYYNYRFPCRPWIQASLKFILSTWKVVELFSENKKKSLEFSSRANLTYDGSGLKVEWHPGLVSHWCISVFLYAASWNVYC